MRVIALAGSDCPALPGLAILGGMAQYRVTYQPNKRHLANVDEPRLFTTPHRAPQPYLWQLGDGEWLKVLRRPAYAPRYRRAGEAVQPPLFA